MGWGLGGVGVNKFVAGAVIVVVFATAQHARATDDIMVTKAPTTPYSAASAYDWTGFYVGSHLGYAGGSSHWSATQDGAAAPSLAGTLDFFNMYNAFRGTGRVYADLRGRVQYDFKEVTPSGEMIVVRDPMITLRLSSLPRVPQAGEKWAITFPPNPADPTPKMYMLGGTRAPRLSASIGFIMLFPIQVVQQ